MALDIIPNAGIEWQGVGSNAGGGMIMWHYICLVVGAVIGWVLCAICTVAKCDDCRAGRLDNGRN